jgi:SAM-dependent methyltransferase
VCGAGVRLNRKGTHRVASCPECGVEFVTPPLDETSGIALQTDCMVHDDSGRTNNYLLIERAMRARLGHAGRALDVGCASGPFMLVLQDRGWSAVGIDVNARAVEVARERGLEAHLGTLDEISFDDAFDAVVAMNALEYFPRPLEALARIADLLRTGGVLAIETPNIRYHRRQAALGRLLGLDRNRLMFVEPAHGRRLIAFGPHSLRLALERAGFDDVTVAPAAPRKSGKRVERLARRTIFVVADTIYRATRKRVLLAPSLIVVATRR